MTEEGGKKVASGTVASTAGSDYREVTTSVIPEVQIVRIYNETIDKIATGHPEVPIELPSITRAVDDAIMEPTHVERSYNDSYVFVKSESTNSSGDPLRVPVRVIDGTSARLKTAYFASTDSDEVDVVWSRSSANG